MIRSDSVLERVRPAGIHGHIAANRAGGLAGRVRCVKKTVRLHRVGHPGVDASRLHQGAEVAIIDLQDLVHAAEANHDPPGYGEDRAAQACARAARNNGHFFLRAKHCNLGNFLGRARQHDNIGQILFQCISVTFIDQQLLLPEDDVFLADDFNKGSQHFRRDGDSLFDFHAPSLIQMPPWCRDAAQGAPIVSSDGG